MSRTSVRIALLLLLLAILAGCVSIPLGTLWRMRNFGAADLAMIDPEQLRVAGLVEPGPMRLDPERTVLTLKLTREHEASDTYIFGLRSASTHDAQLVPNNDPRWQVMELDDAARTAMRRLLPEFETIKQHYNGFSLKVESKFMGDMPTDIETMRLSLRVQLAADQEPLVLFDRARIPVDRSASDSQEG